LRIGPENLGTPEEFKTVARGQLVLRSRDHDRYTRKQYLDTQKDRQDIKLMIDEGIIRRVVVTRDHLLDMYV